MKKNILKRMWNKAAFAAVMLGVAGAVSLASAQSGIGSISSIHSADAGSTFTSPGLTVEFTIRLGSYGSGANYGLVPKPSYEAIYGIDTMLAMFPLRLKMSTGGYAELYGVTPLTDSWNVGKTDFVFRYRVQPGDIGMPLAIEGNAGSSASGDRFTWQNAEYWAVGDLNNANFVNNKETAAWNTYPSAIWRFASSIDESVDTYDVDLSKANIKVYTFDFANAMELNVGDSSSFTLNLRSAYSNAVSLYVWSGNTNYFTLSTQGGILGSGSNTIVSVTFDANSIASSPFVINGLKTTEGLPGGTLPIYASLKNGFDGTTNENYYMSAPVTVNPTTPTIRVSPAESSSFFTESDITTHTLNVTLSEPAPTGMVVTVTCDATRICLVTNSVPVTGASEVKLNFKKNSVTPDETVAFLALDGGASTQISAKPTEFYTTVRGASVTLYNARPVVNGLGNTTANTDYEKTFAYAVGDVAADSATMEVTFDWPDGKEVVTGGVGSVTHTFTSADTYTVTAQAKDKDGDYSDIVTFTVTVTDVTPPPTVSIEPPSTWPLAEGGQYHIDETNQIGYAYVTLSKVYAKGDVEVSLSVTNSEAGVTNIRLLTDTVSIPQGQTRQLISFAVLDGTAKSYTTPAKIIPKVTNDASNTFSRVVAGPVYIDNHAPQIDIPAEGTQVTQVSINTPQTFKFRITDVNDDVAEGMTLSWDWGDGTPETVMTNGTFTTNSVTYIGTFSGETNHTFTGIGTYTVTLTVADKDMSPVAKRTFTVYTATAPFISVAPSGMDSISPRLITVAESDTELATPFIVYLSKPYTQNLDVNLKVTPETGKGSLDVSKVTIKAGDTQSEPFYFRPSDGTSEAGSKIDIAVSIDPGTPNFGLATNFFNGPALGWSVRVQNMPPSLTVFPGGTTAAAPKLLQQNAISTFTWSILDVTNDTQELVWNWGDGTGNTVLNPASFNSWVGHTYTVAGDYEITVRTKDKDGLSSETQHIYVTVVPGKGITVTPLGPATASYKQNGASWPNGLGAGWVESEDAGTYSISQNAYSFSYGSITKQAHLTAIPYRVNSAEDDATVAVTNWVAFRKDGTRNFNFTTTKYDSFFYVWVGADENTFALNEYATTPLGLQEVVVNMGEDATNVSAIAVNAVFSREYLASDFSGASGEVNLGDINLDGVPDIYAIKTDGMSGIGQAGATWAAVAAQLSGGNAGNATEGMDYVATVNLGTFNMDAATNGTPVGDFLPMNLKDRSFVAGVSNVFAAAGAPFTGILEARGFDEHLNWERDEDGNPLNPDFPLDEPGASASPLIRGGTNPCLEDTDGDGLPDGWEYYFWWFYGHTAAESGAEDGRYNNHAAGLVGYAYCPTNVTLGIEIKASAVLEAFNPIVADASILSGSEPRDMDNDGLTDLEELTLGTNPLHWDTDGDGMCDKYEVEFGLNPNNPKDGTTGEDGVRNPDGDYMAYAEVNRLFVTVGETQVLADENGERFWTFYKYGREDDPTAKYAQGRLLSQEEVAALGTPDLENAEGRAVVLVHFQVYMEFGFDPRVAWGKAANSRIFSSLDEYLLAKFLQNVCHSEGFAIKATDLIDYTTNPRTPDTDAVKQGHDGMPDGWELYIAPNFRAMRREFGSINPKSSEIAQGWFPGMAISPWNREDGAPDDNDSDGLTNMREFGGTLSSMGYTNENLYATALTDENHAPMVKVITLARPGADAAWINKFWATDPWDSDTDGDGLSDGDEKAQRFSTGEIPTQNGWPIYLTSFLYASNTVFTTEEYAHTKCFRGCGLNPCSMDSDHDGLPDLWEYQFAGTNAVSGVTGNTYVDGGMDGTHGPANNYNNWTVIGGGDAFSWTDARVYGNSARRRDMDWDNDGLENYQEYWTMAVRGFRYDVSEANLPMEGDGVDPSYFFTQITKDWDLAKNCDWFSPAAPEWVMLPPEGAVSYFSCDPRNPDSDFDGMDDYYELFHGLNPLLGTRDLIASALGNVTATANSFGGSADSPLEMDFVRYPWLAGLPEVDPDADGLLNLEECILGYGSTVAPANTDPSPLWATDSSYTNSYVSRFYVPKTMFFWDLNPEDAPSRYKNYYVFSFEMNEGYDTDNDGISDKNELILTSTSQSEPQWTDDPIRRQALYLDGEQSAAVSFKWSPGVQTRLRFLEFTAELWARPEVVNREQVLLERPVVYPGSDASTGAHRVRVNFRIGIKADGRVYAMFQNAGGHDTESGEMIAYGPVLTANEWTHIACVRDGSKGSFTLYVNGVPYKKIATELMPANGLLSTVFNVDAGDVATGTGSVPGYIVVGAQNVATNVPDIMDASTYPVWGTFLNYYKGYIDEVRIWDGPRTTDQIYENFNRRLTKKDLLENRADILEKRDALGWSRLAGQTQLPAELIYHYTFDNLFGADVAASAATSPRGFASPTVAINRPEDYVCPWWDSWETKSAVYSDYAYIPWIENLVAHLPSEKGYVQDSRYWTKDCAGKLPTAAASSLYNFDEFMFKLEGDPYGLVYRNDTSDGFAYRKKPVTSTNEVRDVAFWLYMDKVENKEVLYMSDLLPLGNAWAKFSTTMWDNGTAGSVWAETGTDSDSDGLPDWWETYRFGDVGSYAWGDIDPANPALTVGEAYMRDLAKGYTENNHPGASGYNASALVPQTSDVDGDGLPDWWENLYNLNPNDATGDNGDMGDPDCDGLSNYAEYLVSEYWNSQYPNVFPIIRPDTYKSATTQHDSDYFIRIGTGTTYLGELFGDHDFMEDDWEDNFAVVNRHLYDAHLDPDDDGWSNWAESRYGTGAHRTDPSLTAYIAANGDTLREYPVPTIKASIHYTGSQNGPIVIEAWSSADVNGIPDARFTIAAETETVEMSKYLGWWNPTTLTGTLSPGSVVPGTFKLFFTDSYSNLGKVLEANVGVDIPNVPSVDGSIYLADFGNPTGIKVGTINYLSGRYTIDLEQYKGQYWTSSEDTVRIYSGRDWVERMMEANPSNSYVTVKYSVKQTDHFPKVYYLADSDESTVEAPSKGHIREGVNYIHAFLDVSGDGIWQPGEPYGVTAPVETRIGHEMNEIEIELTDYQPGYLRFSPSTLTRSEDSYVSAMVGTVVSGEGAEGIGNASTGGPAGGGGGDGESAAASYTRIRIFRSGVDGVAQFTRLILDGTLRAPRSGLTELDLLTSGIQGLDWGLPGIATGANPKDIGYDVYIGEGTLSTNSVVSYRFTNSFDLAQTAAVAVYPSDAYVYSARPTFRWTQPDNYPAFALRIYNSAGRMVYDSGVLPRPPRNDAGECVWTAPVYANGYVPSTGYTFGSNQTYTWRVLALNAKFFSTESEYWSAAKRFRLDVNGADTAPGWENRGYGSIKARIKYHGPARDYLSNRVRFQVYNNAAFAGQPVAEMTLSTAQRTAMLSDADPVVNARVDGILPTAKSEYRYYALAYIDSNQNGVRDVWESWGYANYYGRETGKPYDPLPIIVDTTANIPVVDIRIEDVDTDQDWYPDVWEYEQHPNSETFLEDTAPTASTAATAEFQGLLRSLGTLGARSSAAQLTLAYADDAALDPGLALLAGIPSSTLDEGSDKLALGLAPTDSLSLSLTGIKGAMLSWTLEVGKDRTLSSAARSLLGAEGTVCTYTVEYKATLDGTWKPLATGTVALDNVQQMKDSIQAAIDANPKSCFFRVVLGK
ncbi:MAG: hypothetical protein J6Z49_00075 [Kiritimatiellae bacterium]|nr:hypothetical protein [Kiritimatiellia bacterium]